jgi:glutamyl-tRNA reductase
MHILCLGLNHTTAPLGLREKLALDEEVVRIALARLACGHVALNLSELVLLSTCNRIELYASANDLAFAELEVFLSNVSNVPVETFRHHLYQFQGMDAVRHLFDVAAGLDSLVVGEPQILGHHPLLELARTKYNRFHSEPFFQAAIHAGKRTRTETAISRNPALCHRWLPRYRNTRIVFPKHRSSSWARGRWQNSLWRHCAGAAPKKSW